MTGLPHGWTLATLTDLGDWSSGGTPSRSNSKYFGGDIPFVKTGDLRDETLTEVEETLSASGLANSSAKIFPAGTLLIAMYGATIGRTARLAFDAATNQACAALLENEANADSMDFVWKYLRSQTETLKAAGKGGAQPNISQTVLKEYPIPLPPLPEQRRIVRKLDTLSARSTTARTHLTAIEKLVERYKASVLIRIFSAAATSEKMTTLDKVGKLVCGQSPASATVNRNGVGTPYCTGPEQWDGLKIHLDKWTTDPKRIVDQDSIFITVKGSGVGTLFPGTQCAIGRDVYAYVPDPNSLEWRFAFCALRYEIASILINVKGLIPGLSKPDILENPVFVPSLDEQREIVRRIEAAFAKIDRLAAEAAKALKLLGHLDQRILAKAFAGDLVPQDPTDEPAETLLARIRTERVAAPKAKRRGKAKV